MPIAAVLFDLDGTLVDSEREYAEAMARALELGLGLRVDQADRDFIVGRSWVDIHEQLRRRYGERLAWSREQLVEQTVTQRRVRAEQHPLPTLPGAREAVARFGGLPRGLVTGSARVEAELALAELGLRDAFAACICCEDYPRSKPAPDGYLIAAQALAVSPQQCLVVEDSAAGIAAGLTAGAVVVAVRAGNFAGADQSAAHAVVDTLDDLTLDLVRELAP